MKKLGLLVMPLMAVSFLASCGGGNKPGPDPEKEFTVTFDANGGTLIGESSIKVKNGTLFEDITNIPGASKEPSSVYVFNGWGLTKDSTETISDYKITSDLTVYAVYLDTTTAVVSFSSESENCKLVYKYVSYDVNTSFYIPSEVEVIIDVEANDGYLPVFDGALTYSGEGTCTFDSAKQQIKVNVPKDSTCTIIATAISPKENLEAYEWTEISQLSRMGLAKKYFDIYDPAKPTLNCKKVQLKPQDTNNNGEIDDNEFYQTVRIIDFNKDVDPDGNNLGITFEFADLLSDANGYSLASLWQNTSTTEGSNYNYLDSTIRKNLTGNGRGSIMWYEKDSGTISKEYTTSVYDVLPDDLQDVLKTARKKVNSHTTGDWVETDVDDKLFLLSPNEMNKQTDLAEEGEAYEYYKKAAPDVADPIRIKQQIKKSDGATTTFANITESAYGSGYSYAGYNSSTEGKGGNSWLRSPDTYGSDFAWYCYDTGDLYNDEVYDYAYAVAPAFCV